MSSRRASEAVQWSAWSFAFSFGLLLLPVVGRTQSTPNPFPVVTLRLAPTPPVLPGDTKQSDGSADASVAPPSLKARSAFEAISSEVQAIFAKCKGAVVRIEATDAYGTNAGTGFFIDPAGTIYTHYSVAGHSGSLLVEFAGKKYPATSLLADVRSGVTLLKIEAGQTPFLPLGKSTDLKVASPVVAIGYPMDLPVTPTFGLVAGFDQRFFDHYLPTTHIRANVPVQLGESGAPLLNEKGEVVGILMCQFDYGAVCLSLPIQAAEKVRMDYLRFGYPRPGWIGVTAKPVNGGDDDSRVSVDDLSENSPAVKCGLQKGDTLVRVGKTPIHRFADLRDASFFLTAEETVPITVLRDDKEITLSVHAADPPGMSMSLPPVRLPEGGGQPFSLPMPRDPK